MSAATAGGYIQLDTAADVVNIVTSDGDLKLLTLPEQFDPELPVVTSKVITFQAQ